MARFGVRSGSVLFVRADDDPVNQRVGCIYSTFLQIDRIRSAAQSVHPTASPHKKQPTTRRRRRLVIALVAATSRSSTIAALSQVPDLLVSDAERERVADDLRGHYQAGRLTLEEFQQRLDEAHAARTATQLKSALRQLPSARVPTVNPRDTRWRSLALQYALVNVVATLVWLFGGQHGDFWPKWVLLATLIMFTRRTFGRRRRLPPPSTPE
jgi:Domain of unknown function (DUF1707)